MSHFERSEAESRNLLLNRFLHFGPLRGPPVEMTKAQILITIGITGRTGPFRPTQDRGFHGDFTVQSGKPDMNNAGMTRKGLSYGDSV